MLKHCHIAKILMTYMWALCWDKRYGSILSDLNEGFICSISLKCLVIMFWAPNYALIFQLIQFLKVCLLCI